ncbi:AMP-dependent synthetase/ligase [Haliangium ochraceum]|uniref:AMP-dependent synthetase and ligase n=1 Tax=Haliangium ochraceum (strain DSM 14365 / JCM 11303 / SMP-2) TaxID=502025 RepID=D0LK81_HALO1|nr:AMP-binding protein [Haliangium ochraceum]ACY13115.1 AMP-dependent synthetase and ligase [Haliangium ochraceum DSM 14365]
MDVTPFLELHPAPHAVFERIANDPALGERPRFHVPAGGGESAAWVPVSWNRFAAQIRQVAMYLHDSGFAAGERAAIYAPNSIAWAAAALGIQACGGVMVPVYPASTAEQLAYVLRHSDAKAMFVATAPLLERTASIRAQVPMLERVITLGAIGAEPSTPASSDSVSWDELCRSGQQAHDSDPEAVARMIAATPLDTPSVMLYTSGTSGPPKGVPLTHENVGVNARDWLECNGPLLDEDMVDLLWLPMSHIFGFGELCLGNTLGFTSYTCTPPEVLGRLPEVRPSVLMSVPAYWEKIAQAAAAAPEAERCQRLEEVTGGRLQFCLSGGAGLKREVKELFYGCGLLIIEGYGLTETSPTLTLNRPGDFRFDTVGKSLPSVELKLADDGEILARGANVFSGYHKDPEATAACFTEDGWFCTGDIGRFTEDGFLQIVDRKKDILVTAGGKNVPPANIELRFADDPTIAHLVVYGDGKKYLVAGVWLDRAAAARAIGSESPGPEQLEALVQTRIDAVNTELARHETIKRFCIMDEPLTVEGGQLTASLKLRRKHVYKAFHDQFEALYDAPRS